MARVRSEQKVRFPKTLQGRLLRYAAERWKSGKALREVAEELGNSGHTLSYWRAQLLAKDESTLKPIQSCRRPEPDAHRVGRELCTRRGAHDGRGCRAAQEAGVIGKPVGVSVYACAEACDMRKSFNTLAAMPRS